MVLIAALLFSPKSICHRSLLQTHQTWHQHLSIIAYVTTRTVTVPTAIGCSYPVVKAFADLVAEYFLNAGSLTIMSFEDKENVSSGAVEMQRVMQEFLSKCVAAGKTKLIVNLNAKGGVLWQGLYFFRTTWILL